ncbi:MAG: adenylate/guanylate cyclase domain-containing protein [bacterium]|nr:adenylate/guanylate cyclase domain-containing protein [bacterium]
MALRILMCEKVEDIPVLRESPNRYMFDYNYFAKFGIDLSDIPFDSIVLNKPRSYMDALWTYRELILIIFVIIAFLISVIVILSMNILKRKKVEAKLSKTNIAYNRFVPHEFLFNLKKDDIIDVELGDQVEREMTILFSDIRSFTTLSESMTPEENFNFLNSYLKIVSPVIRDHEGFIDKYIGDAIMAIFPEVPEDAVAAAVEMQRQVIEYNIGRKEAGYPPIRIGIGLHFGGLMLGTVGEEQRMEGTVISDAVNLASRLEGLTKLFGAGIIISEQVLEALGERKLKYNYRFLGKVQVKGKTGAVQIYEIIDGNIAGIVERKLKTKSIFEKGLASYHGRDFAKAQERFKNVIKLDQKDKAAALYLERSVFYLNNEIPNNWDGVEKLDNK